MKLCYSENVSGFFIMTDDEKSYVRVGSFVFRQIVSELFVFIDKKDYMFESCVDLLPQYTILEQFGLETYKDDLVEYLI